MKKHTILFTVLFMFCITMGVHGQQNIETVFGTIRANMIREAAKELGVPDSIREKITEESLSNFNRAIENKDSAWKILTQSPKLLSTETLGKAASNLLTYNEKLKEIKGYNATDFSNKINDAKDNLELFKKTEAELISVQNEINKLKEQSKEQQLLEDPFEIEQKENKLNEMQDKLDSISDVNRNLKEEIANTHNPKYRTILDYLFSFLKIIFILLLSFVTFFVIKRFLKRRWKSDEAQKVRKDLSEVGVSQKEQNTILDNAEKSEIPAKEEQPDIITQPKDNLPPISLIQLNDKHAFAQDADEWIVVGASVVGNGHITQNMPCQDYHKYEYLGDGWGIAIVSDGAGSAEKSEHGSKLVAIRGIDAFKELIEKKGWKEKNELPTDDEWREAAYRVLKQLRNDMELLATNKLKVPVKALSATAIVVVHTPDGILATHVGDGRAGYKDEKGEWKSLIGPHSGEEANQTIFLPSDFWDIPYFKMSGRYVPESVIIREKPFGFVLMSDGCEATAWQCYSKEKDVERYFDPNIPHSGFFKPLDKTLQSFRQEKISIEERAEKWWKFIESGNASFIKETDDKTMILGVIYL